MNPNLLDAKIEIVAKQICEELQHAFKIPFEINHKSNAANAHTTIDQSLVRVSNSYKNDPLMAAVLNVMRIAHGKK
jgi:hypothetical protein